MKANMPRDPEHFAAIEDWTAALIGHALNRDPAFIVEQLNGSLCDHGPTALNGAVAIAPPLVNFYVGKDDVPISFNATWNACIRDRVSLGLVRNNPDRIVYRSGRVIVSRGRSCDDYHRIGDGTQWWHPDLKMFFTWDREKHLLTVPKGYVAVRRNALQDIVQKDAPAILEIDDLRRESWDPRLYLL